MKTNGSAALAAVVGLALAGGVARPAVADCTLTGLAYPPLSEIPQGCELFLANGPLTFDVIAGNKNPNTGYVDIVINTIDVFMMYNPVTQTTTPVMYIAGTKTSGAEGSQPQAFGGDVNTLTESDTSNPVTLGETDDFTFTALSAANGLQGGGNVPGGFGFQLDTSTNLTDCTSLVGQAQPDCGQTLVTGADGTYDIATTDIFNVDLTFNGTYGGTNLGGYPNSLGPQEVEMQLGDEIYPPMIPEPGSITLLGVGLLGLGLLHRWTKSNACQ